MDSQTEDLEPFTLNSHPSGVGLEFLGTSMTGGHTRPPLSRTGGHTRPPLSRTGGHTRPPLSRTGGASKGRADGSVPLAWDCNPMPSVPKQVISLADSVNVSWHVFDISSNYILKKINWADMIINLKDDKLLISFAFTYYKLLTREMLMNEVKACLPAPGTIDVNAMRDYFNLTGFESIFREQDQEMVSMCQLTPDDFIVLPIYETRSHIYMALFNINVDFGIYLQSVYGTHLTTSSSNDSISFCNLFEIAHGLQNHASITGIQHATSFNLFRALYKTSLSKLVTTSHNYAYNPKPIKLTDMMELPIIALYNSYNYWPQLQVVWTCNKIMLALPGAKKPTNESLLRNNKLLARVYADSLIDSPKIPKVMLRKYETNIDKVRTRWIEKYNKFCKAPEGDPICQYTNMDKLIGQMSKIKLEVHDLCSLQSQKD
jgi:hypothetical protein